METEFQNRMIWFGINCFPLEIQYAHRKCFKIISFDTLCTNRYNKKSDKRGSTLEKALQIFQYNRKQTGIFHVYRITLPKNST